MSITSNLKIEFEIAGVTRLIKHDGLCHHAITPNGKGNPKVLGYYNTVGEAVLSHIKNACIEGDIEVEEQEAISLLQFVDRIESLYAHIKGTTKEEIAGAVITGEIIRPSWLQSIADSQENNKEKKVRSKVTKDNAEKRKEKEELDPTPKVLPPIEDEDEGL